MRRRFFFLFIRSLSILFHAKKKICALCSWFAFYFSLKLHFDRPSFTRYRSLLLLSSLSSICLFLTRDSIQTRPFWISSCVGRKSRSPQKRHDKYLMRVEYISIDIPPRIEEWKELCICVTHINTVQKGERARERVNAGTYKMT